MERNVDAISVVRASPDPPRDVGDVSNEYIFVPAMRWRGGKSDIVEVGVSTTLTVTLSMDSRMDISQGTFHESWSVLSTQQANAKEFRTHLTTIEVISQGGVCRVRSLDRHVVCPYREFIAKGCCFRADLGSLFLS